MAVLQCGVLYQVRELAILSDIYKKKPFINVIFPIRMSQAHHESANKVDMNQLKKKLLKSSTECNIKSFNPYII